MDAANRSFHVYGKSASGAAALRASREGIAPSARRLLILVDGQRTIGELAEMLGTDAVERDLALLGSLGHIELVRLFPDGAGRSSAGVAGCALESAPESAAEWAPAGTPEPVSGDAFDDASGDASGDAIDDTIDDTIDDAPADLAAAAPVEPEPLPPAVPRPSPRTRRRVDLDPRWALAVVAVLLALAVATWLGTRGDTAAVAPATELHRDPADAGPRAPSGASPLTTPDDKARAAVAAPVLPRASAPQPAPRADAAVLPRAAPESAPAVSTLRVRQQYTPEIPKAVRDRGITSGQVVVVLQVDPQGTVQSVELVKADPPDVYDAAMAQTFARWTFEPLGIPGRMTVEVAIRPAQ